jgi:hypothetical protein
MLRGWRTRTLMISIAIVALMCAFEAMRRRSKGYQMFAVVYERLAFDCQFRASVADRAVGFTEATMRFVEDSTSWDEQLGWWSTQGKRNRALASHYEHLRDAYRLAASRPWIYLPIDQAIPSREPSLPPWELLLEFETDPITHERTPAGAVQPDEAFPPPIHDLEKIPIPIP